MYNTYQKPEIKTYEVKTVLLSGSDHTKGSEGRGSDTAKQFQFEDEDENEDEGPFPLASQMKKDQKMSW